MIPGYYSRCLRSFIKQRGWLLLSQLSLNLFYLRHVELLGRSHRSFIIEGRDILHYSLRIFHASLDNPFIYPIIIVDLFKNTFIVCEQDDFTTAFRVIQVSRSLLNFTTENCLSIKLAGDESGTSIRVNSTLVIIPYSYHWDLSQLWKFDWDQVIIPSCEGCQPHMQIVIGEIIAIYQFINCTWITTIPW